jgi:hypothetical protein
MAWVPVGPDFVLAPKNSNYLRVSRRNFFGKQCEVDSIALDPSDPRTLYVVNRPNSGGTSASRTRDDGRSWAPIVDDLQRVDPRIDPSAIAVNPAHAETVYMATWATMGCLVSTNRGEPGSWSAPSTVPGSVYRLVVDPRTASDPARTRIFAATTTGLFISDDGGASWPSTPVVAGDVYSFTAWMPPTGASRYYAGVSFSGLWYATDPLHWTNLSVGIRPTDPLLPAHNPDDERGNFERVSVDFSRRNPDRVYVWLTQPDTFVALYTTTAATRQWTQVAVRSHGSGPESEIHPGGPAPSAGYYGMAFAVAADSPGLGDGSRDVLFIGSETFWRSIDGGRTWQDDRGFMSDFHAIVSEPVGDRVPTIYIGCDGGIAKSSRIANPHLAIPPHGQHAPGEYNETRVVEDTAIWQTLDQGLHAIAPYGYGCDPAIGALHYVACQDTGFAAGTGGSLVWRDLGGSRVGGDGFQIAVAPGSDGVKLWLHYNTTFDLVTDQGRLQPPAALITLGRGGPGILNTSTNLAVDSTGQCVAGVMWSPSGGSAQGTLVRIDQTAIATQISAAFPVSDRQITTVAVHPTDPSTVYFATSDNRLWRTAPGPGSTEITLPSGLPAIVSIAIDLAGTTLALVDQRTVDATNSPVLHVVGSSAALEAGRFPARTVFDLPYRFGPFVAHPSRAGVFFAGHGARVYQLTFQQNEWVFDDVSDGLPGQWIYDLRAISIGGSGTPPPEVLRVAIPTRGVWERQLPGGPAPSTEALYLRDNVLDSWWANPSPVDVPSPFDPSNSGERLFHYLCSDIKVDARRPGIFVDDFFQTDPEANPRLDTVDPERPMTHAVFGALADNSRHLPGDDAAWGHIQVHNHRAEPTGEVRVWALFTNAAGGVPSLEKREDMSTPYNFWSQFRPDGSIVPDLPRGSPWRAIGPPVTLRGLSAASPQVASWPWTVPLLRSGDRGHYCIVAFVHSRLSPLRASHADVDRLVPRTKQIGQKNLHIGAPLSPLPFPLSDYDLFGPWGDGRVYESIEFHNPDASERIATLVFDQRSLPRELRLAFAVSRLDTVRPLAASMAGIARTVRVPVLPVGAGVLLRLLGRLPWLWQLLGLRERTVYEAQRSALVEVREVRLPPHGSCSARFAVQNTGELPNGSRYRFHVQQKVKDKVVGGSVYVLEIDGEAPVQALGTIELEELEVEDRLSQVLIYQREAVAERIRESRRS